MFSCFLSQRIYLIWKALAETIVTKLMFLSSFLCSDVITLPGLYTYLYA